MKAGFPGEEIAIAAKPASADLRARPLAKATRLRKSYEQLTTVLDQRAANFAGPEAALVDEIVAQQRLDQVPGLGPPRRSDARAGMPFIIVRPSSASATAVRPGGRGALPSSSGHAHDGR